MRKTLLASVCAAILGTSTSFATPISNYDNVFISYYTPQNVQAMVNYAKQRNLGGVIVWEFKGDTDFNSSDSLLAAAKNSFANYRAGNEAPMVMGYWSDWSLYTADPATRAIPEAAYPVPGSKKTDGTIVSAEETQDFTNKLNGMNVVAYAFLEAQAREFHDSTTGKTVTNPNYNRDGGTLYFNDPWGDLTMDDSFCNGGNNICSYVTDMKRIAKQQAGRAATQDPDRSMGNFAAFARLTRNGNNALGPLKKVISIGGYGHDNTFEDTIGNATYRTNFVNSAVRIINAYGIDGIDLDYENPSMSLQQSRDFATLVQALRNALPNKLITVTIMSGPDYIAGRNNVGFDASALRQIGQIADRVNLMTYDFHGAFDYDPANGGKTGLITNLYKPTQNPTEKFSVDGSVTAAIAAGVPSNKINVGIPAYGRALAGISSNNGGLFQVISNMATLPRGDLDSADCTIGIDGGYATMCSGSFQYKYIVANMRGKGFVETTNIAASGESNGTSAFATKWNVPIDTSNYSLEIINNGSGSDLGFNVSISDGSHNFGPDWFNPGADKTYTSTTNPSTSSIRGISNLTINWATGWGPQGSCPVKFNFTENSKVRVRVDNQGRATCSVSRG